MSKRPLQEVADEGFETSGHVPPPASAPCLPPSMQSSDAPTVSSLQAVDVQRRVGGVGGSGQTVLQRNRKPPTNRKDNALKRVTEKLGEQTLAKMREDWAMMETGAAGREWETSDGIVINLIQSGFSEMEIRAIIPVGGYKIGRLRDVLKVGFEQNHTRRPPRTPAHAVVDADLDAIKQHALTWEVEDGFPCAHRRPKQYLVDPKLTFTKLYQGYGCFQS